MHVKTLYPIIFGLLFSGFSFSQTVDPYTIDENTILLMHFDGNLNEEVSNYAVVNHGIAKSYINNPIVGLGDAIYFDNSNQSNGSFISVPYSDELSLSNNWTVEFWFNIDEWDQNHNKWPIPIVLPAVGWDSNYYLEIPAEWGRLKYGFSSSDGGATILSSENSITTKTWYHVALINDYDNNLIKLILRDADFEKLEEQSSSYNAGATISTGTEDLRIGSGFAGDNSFNGYMDELRISNVVRDFSPVLPELPPLQAETEEVEFYASNDNSSYWSSISTYADDAVKELISIWERPINNVLSSDEKVKIYLIDRDELDSFSLEVLTEWKCGFYDDETRSIFISPLVTNKQTEYYGSFDELVKNTLGQLVIKLSQNNLNRHYTPFYFMEGLGLYYSGYRPNRDTIILALDNLGRLPLISDLASINPDDYTQGTNKDLIVSYIEAQKLSTRGYGYITADEFENLWQHHFEYHYLAAEDDRIMLRGQSDNFNIYCTAQDVQFIDAMLTVLEAKLISYSNDYQVEYPHSYDIEIFPNRDVANHCRDITSYSMGTGSAGDKLDILSPLHLEGGLQGVLDFLIPHEFFHIFHNHMFKLFFPPGGPFHGEGLANFMTQKKIDRNPEEDGSLWKIGFAFDHFQNNYGHVPTLEDLMDDTFDETYQYYNDPYYFGDLFYWYITTEVAGFLEMKAFFETGNDWSVYPISYEEIDAGYIDFLKIYAGITVVEEDEITPYISDENTILLMHLDGDLTNSSTLSGDGTQQGGGISYSTGTFSNFDQCLELDGSSYITIPHNENLNLTGDWTIEMWFKITSLNAGLINKPASNGWVNYNIHVEAPDGHMEARFYDTNGNRYQINTPSGTIEINKWYFVAFINNTQANSIRLLLKDEAYTSIFEQSLSYPAETIPNNSNYNVTIGESVTGFIDELRISNVVRDFSSTVDKTQVTSENFIIYYDQENSSDANTILNQLQSKTDFYKKYFKYFFTDHTKIFSVNICKDLTEFDQYKPDDLPDFETSYINDGILYLITPTTPAQQGYFDSFEQAAMHGFTMRCVDYLYNFNAAEWMKYGFARHQSGMKSTPEQIRAEVSNLGRKPTYQEMYNWEESASFDKYLFAYTMIQYIADVHSLDYLMGFIRFENNTTVYGFRQYNTEEKFNEVWHYNLNVFYLRDNNLMEFQRESDHFYFYMTDEDALELDQFETEMEIFYTRFTNDMQMTIGHKIHIFFYPEKCDYQLIQGFDYCDPNDNSVGEKLGIALAKFTRTYSDAPMMNSIGLALHELTHVIHGNLDFEDNPAWLSEGLATLVPEGPYSSDRINELKEQVNVGFSELAAAVGRYPTVEDAESETFFDQYGIYSWGIGVQFVDYLIKTSGYIAIKNFIISDALDYTTLGFTDSEDFTNSFYTFYNEVWGIPPQEVSANKTNESIIIDGVFDEADWNLNQDITEIYPFYQTWKNNEVKYGILWDNNYLYVAVEVLDSKLIDNSNFDWNDGIAIYIDGDFNKGFHYDTFDRQFIKRWNNTALEEKNNLTDGVQHAVQNIDGGYAVELAIPWTNLGITQVANTTIGFDISNLDEDCAETYNCRYQLIWSGNNYNGDITVNFGELTLALNDNVTEILDLRENNSLGIPIHLDETVTVSGIVTASNDFGTNGPAYIQDDQAGIAVFGSEFVSLLSKGDSITITGKVTLYNGLTELVYVEGESELIIHKNTNKPDPEIVNILDILDQTWDGVELLEGKLLQIENVTFVESGTFSGNTDYQITDGTNYLTVRIDSDTGMEGMLIPTTTFSIVGCLSQFDNSEPYSTGYRIFPRNQGDIPDVEFDLELVGSSEHFEFYTNISGEENFYIDIQNELENEYSKLSSLWNRPGINNIFNESENIKVYYSEKGDIFRVMPDTPNWKSGFHDVQSLELYLSPFTNTEQENYYTSLKNLAINEFSQLAISKKLLRENSSYLPSYFLEGFGLYEIGFRPRRDSIIKYINENPIPDFEFLRDTIGISNTLKKDLIVSNIEGQLLSGWSYLNVGAGASSFIQEQWPNYLKYFYTEPDDQRLKLLETSSHFNFYGAESDNEHFSEIVSYFENAFSFYDEHYNYAPEHMFNVVITPTEAIGMGLQNFKDYFNGGTGWGGDLVVVLSPNYNFNQEAYDKWYAGLVAHEFFHIYYNHFMWEIPGGFWAEGCADFSARHSLGEDIRRERFWMIAWTFNEYAQQYNVELDLEHISTNPNLDLDIYYLGDMFFEYIYEYHGGFEKIMEFFNKNMDYAVFNATYEEIDSGYISYLKGFIASDLDDDNDGVMNDIDICPDTPTGESVDENGCSESQKDDDNDGVMNNVDTCSNTPTGESVDENGCSESQKDDDNDGVMNVYDLCPNTPSGASVDATGCFVLPSNNFEIEVIGETCLDKDNGQIVIEAEETHNYVATINGTQYSFTSDLTVINLAPGLYDFCISVSGENYQQCFVVVVTEGVTVSGKSSVSKNKVTVEITKGTAPFDVMVNGDLLYQTMSATFDVFIKHSDVINVKTSVDCEGVYSKTIELFDVITVYPNPSDGIFEIAIPLEQKDVFIEVYNFASLLIQSKNYTIQYGKVTIDLTSEPTGIYIVKIHADNPINVKIIKN